MESREQKRVYNTRHEYPAKHPRASTSDDVECFFSVLRDTVGSHFTHKDVQYAFRKCCNEFCKRLNADLQFWYHTSDHDRFYEGMRPEFSEGEVHLFEILAIRGLGSLSSQQVYWDHDELPYLNQEEDQHE